MDDHCRHTVRGSAALYSHALQVQVKGGVETKRGPNGAGAITDLQLPPYNGGSREAYDATRVADERDLAGDDEFVKNHRTCQGVSACR